MYGCILMVTDNTWGQRKNKIYIEKWVNALNTGIIDWLTPEADFILRCIT